MYAIVEPTLDATPPAVTTPLIIGAAASVMFGAVPPDDAILLDPVTLVTPVPPTIAVFGMVFVVMFAPLIDGAATSVMFGVEPPDEAILPEPVTLLTPVGGIVAAMVRLGAEPVIEIFAPAVNAVSGVVTSAALGIVAAVMPAPLMVGGTENVVAARFVVPTTVSPEFALSTAPLTLIPAGNV